MYYSAKKLHHYYIRTEQYSAVYSNDRYGVDFIPFLNDLMDIYETLYENHATRRCPVFVLAEILLYRVCQLLRQEP